MLRFVSFCCIVPSILDACMKKQSNKTKLFFTVLSKIVAISVLTRLPKSRTNFHFIVAYEMHGVKVMHVGF